MRDRRVKEYPCNPTLKASSSRQNGFQRNSDYHLQCVFSMIIYRFFFHHLPVPFPLSRPHLISSSCSFPLSLSPSYERLPFVLDDTCSLTPVPACTTSGETMPDFVTFRSRQSAKLPFLLFIFPFLHLRLVWIENPRKVWQYSGGRVVVIVQTVSHPTPSAALTS